jgi:hypothetical protein
LDISQWLTLVIGMSGSNLSIMLGLQCSEAEWRSGIQASRSMKAKPMEA